MDKYKIYCAGKFIDTQKTLEVKNSFDESLVGSTFLAGDAELDAAIEAAIAIRHGYAGLPSWKRFEILSHISAEIRAKREQIAKILAAEACKPLKLALGETDRAAQVFLVAAEESKRLPMEYMRLDWTPAGTGKEGLIKYFPVGLVGGISPFNFPLNLSAHKIAPAIASACPIILKPATSTPLTVLELAKIIDASELPRGAVSILPMDRTTGNRLVTDERFALLSFTGSPEVGWQMKRDAGKKKVVLELGGNAGAIVTASCNLELAVTKCVGGAFAYSGQVCIHTQRIFVHASIFENFCTVFKEKAAKLKSGGPLDPDADISAMIDEANAIRVEEWVNEALKSGAKLLCGGSRQGTYFPPTVLTNTSADMKVNACEVFGPVVTIEPYDDFKKAVEHINHGEFGLQAGVFTNEITEADYAFNHLEVGGVIINDVPTFRVDHMPYGGVKNSGLGREGIKYAIMDMMEARIMVK